MKRKRLVLVLGLTIVAGVLFSVGCRGREPEVGAIAAGPDANATTPTETSLPPTATRKAGPVVVQATRAATATAAPTETCLLYTSRCV